MVCVLTIEDPPLKGRGREAGGGIWNHWTLGFRLPTKACSAVNRRKSTSTVGSPNTTKTNPPKKNRPAGWREGLRVALCVVPTDLRASLPRELRQRLETHPHTWFAKRHKNKPTQRIYVCVLCPHYHCCCHKNKPTQKQNSPAGWRDGLTVALCVVPALPLLLPQKQTHSKNLCLCVVSVLPLLLPQKQTHPKKRRSVWMTGRI